MKTKATRAKTLVTKPLPAKTVSHQQMLGDLLPGEKCYPIYYVDVRWSEDVDEKYGPPEPWQTAGLPLGRIWNSTGWDTMFREVRDFADIEAETLREWWPTFATKMPNPSDPDILVKFVRWEVWCPSWFSHWTFDVGMSDADVLGSFIRYVDRTEMANRREGHMADGYWHDPYCLMGAEDRWRWHGCVDGNPQGERTEPPCRCPACKKRGIVRVDH
jgi:hypothetical protein